MNLYRSVSPFTLLIALAGFVAEAADWPQYLGPNRNAISDEKGLARTWPEAGPKELWSIDVGEGYASAAIRDGEVYVLDRVEGASDVLRCLSLADGKELWSYKYDAAGNVGHNGSRTPPTVDEEYVYSVGMMGDFLCTDRKSHQPVWQKNLAKDFGVELPRWGFSQSPVLYKNLVILSVQSPDAFVVAFDKEKGDVVWKSAGLGLPGYVSPSIATLGGVEQVIAVGASNRGATEKGGTAGISLADGSILWTYDGWQCFIPIPNPIVLPGDKLFITGGYNSGSAIIQVKKSGDKFEVSEVKKFTPEECGSQIQQPILYKDHIYVGSNSNERMDGLTCYTLDGEIKWRTDTAKGQPSIERGSFIIADDLMIALDGKTGILHLIEPNPNEFKHLGQVPCVEGRELWGPLALSNGKLIVRSQDKMKCLDLKAS